MKVYVLMHVIRVSDSLCESNDQSTFNLSKMVRVLACLALAASATAFAPSTEIRKMTRLNGYVPDGLSPAEYNAAKAKDNSAANANKVRFPKGKKAVDMDVWVKKMECAAASFFKDQPSRARGRGAGPSDGFQLFAPLVLTLSRFPL